MRCYTFEFTRVGYIGLVGVRIDRGNPGIYRCLFTCLQIRTINLEATDSMSTDSFLMSLMRFLDSDGKSDAVSNDNGSNCVGSDCELNWNLHVLDQKKMLAE